MNSVEATAPSPAAEQARDRRGRALFEAIGDVVFVHDLEGHILDANPAACRHLGHDRDELLHLTLRDIEEPEFAAGLDQRLRDQRVAGALIYDGRHVARDGRVIPVEVNSSVVRIEGVPLVLAVVRDVSRRKRAEDALRESEAFYHSLVETLPQNIIRKDRDGRFTFVNQHVRAMLGRPLEDIVGKTDFDLFPPDLAAKYRRDDEHVLRTGTSLETIEEHRTPDGATLHVQIVKTPIYDAHGDLIGTQVLFWDVTERHRWEEALTESERRYRQLTEASQDAIVVADQAGRITLFNPAAERTFGYAAAEVIGQPLDLLVPGDYRERHRLGFERYVATREARLIGRPTELRGRRKDGTEFPLDLSISAIDLGGELQFLGAIRDTTERNRMRTALVQSEKLASIGLLSAGMAHEINNPLAVAVNNLAILERDTRGLLALVDLYERAAEPSAAARAFAEEIDLPYLRANLDRLLDRTRDGLQRVSRIVQSLRGLASTDPPRLEDASLPDLVDMSLGVLRGRLDRRGVRVELDYGPTRVRCVPSQISQMLLNLLANAVDAIEARTEPGPGTIRLSTRRAGNELVIEVADNGCGVDPQDLPRLFDPFFTRKPVGQGTGLGLSVSHGIVTGHGGRIEVESRPNEGSRFRVFLPLQENHENPRGRKHEKEKNT